MTHSWLFEDRQILNIIDDRVVAINSRDQLLCVSTCVFSSLFSQILIILVNYDYFNGDGAGL